jgi:ligand-binding sensor domain-containing protein
MRHYCFLLWVLLLPIMAEGQKVDFQIYTVKDGLPQNWVHRVIQDQQGYMWLSMPNGL